MNYLKQIILQDVVVLFYEKLIFHLRRSVLGQERGIPSFILVSIHDGNGQILLHRKAI
jgi:hypothetical protein